MKSQTKQLKILLNWKSTNIFKSETLKVNINISYITKPLFKFSSNISKY